MEEMGNTVRIAIPSDSDGYFGRECPVCDGFFKVTPGTGLSDTTDAFCPYCGHHGPADTFWTSEQMEYAKSVILNRVTGQFLQVVTPQPPGPGSASPTGPTVKDTRGADPVRLHLAPEFQADLVCDRCTLRYAVFGRFICCPDCGARGTPQIVQKNEELASKLPSGPVDLSPPSG
jgi:hypothetical protein